jgi:hypothetical protein
MSLFQDRFKNYAQLIEIIGILSIVGTLIFVIIELQQSQQISFADQDLASIEIELALTTEINKHIDIWTKGNAGEQLDDRSAAIYRNLLDSVWVQASKLSQARSRLGANSNVAIHEFAVFLHENTGAKERWLKTFAEYNKNKTLLDYNAAGSEVRDKIVLADLATLANPPAPVEPNQ